MDFDAKQWLESHDNDPEKALSALARKWNDEGKAAARARTQRDEAKSERDALRDQLADAEKRAAPDGATVLTGDDAAAWQTFKERGGLKAFDEAEQVKQERDALKRQADLTEAAQALGKPADALAEILEGKTLEKRTVKAQDGTESEQWGIPQGDTFKPLAELRSIQLLGTAQPDKPAPAPLPTGQRGGNAKPTDPVQALNAALFGGPKEN